MYDNRIIPVHHCSLGGLTFVVASMLGTGLSLTVAQIIQPLKDLRLVILALLANFVLVPLLAFGSARLFPLDEALQIGLIVLATTVGANNPIVDTAAPLDETMLFGAQTRPLSSTARQIDWQVPVESQKSGVEYSVAYAGLFTLLVQRLRRDVRPIGPGNGATFNARLTEELEVAQRCKDRAALQVIRKVNHSIDAVIEFNKVRVTRFVLNPYHIVEIPHGSPHPKGATFLMFCPIWANSQSSRSSFS